MNINLANIDFAPGQGGGGEAVIRSLNVTENGTYRAPSGVDGYNPVEVRVAGGGGSVTPDEQAMLDVLTENSEGLLNKKLYKHNTIVQSGYMFNNSDWPSKQEFIDGELYCCVNNELFKFNTDTLSYERAIIVGQWIYNPIWKDNSGRYYMGVSKELNFDTGETTSISMNAYSYTSENTTTGFKDSLYRGQYGIYVIGTVSQKFNESTQQFENWPYVTFESGYDADTLGPNMCKYGFNYNGHYIYVDTMSMFELIETENSIDIVHLNEPYFPLYSSLTGDSFNDSTRFIMLGDTLYYFNPYNIYKLVNGDWEVDTFYTEGGDVYSDYYGQVGCYFDGWLVGFGTNNQNFKISNVSDDLYFTSWNNVNQVAVDLKSGQTIYGQKSFQDGISANSISTTNLSTDYGYTNFILGKNNTVANKITVLVGGLFTINGNNVTTDDKVILNRTYKPYGPYTTIQTYDSVFQGYSEMNWFFKTHTGRVFFVNTDGVTAYEFDGTDWSTQYTLSVNYMTNNQNGMVVVTPNATFYSYLGVTYMWDDANSNFVQLCTYPGGNDSWSTWWDGSNLRSSEYILVENGGVWEWQAHTISDYKNGMYYYVNSTVYCLCSNGLYTFDPATDGYTAIGDIHYWTNISFMCGGDVIFPYNGEKWMKIDFSDLTPDADGYVDRDTDLLYDDYSDYSRVHYEYDNKTLAVKSNYWFYYYGMDASVPEVPASNGTYTLKAVRSGDTVTYSWVLDV